MVRFLAVVAVRFTHQAAVRRRDPFWLVDVLSWLPHLQLAKNPSFSGVPRIGPLAWTNCNRPLGYSLERLSTSFQRDLSRTEEESYTDTKDGVFGRCRPEHSTIKTATVATPASEGVKGAIESSLYVVAA